MSSALLVPQCIHYLWNDWPYSHLYLPSQIPISRLVPFGPNPNLRGSPFLPSQMEEHPKSTSAWPLPFTLSLNAMVSSSTPRWSFACSMNIQGGNLVLGAVWPQSLIDLFPSCSLTPGKCTLPCQHQLPSIKLTQHLPLGVAVECLTQTTCQLAARHLPAGNSLVTLPWCCNSLCQGLLKPDPSTCFPLMSAVKHPTALFQGYKCRVRVMNFLVATLQGKETSVYFNRNNFRHYQFKISALTL